MSGWLDWIEDEIICPFCNYSFEVIFCEDGELNREPIVITTLAGDKTICPNCKKEITDDVINIEND